MRRLIDVDELRWAIRNNAPKSVPIWVYQAIDNAPTAYDVDAVVEQLDEYITKIVGRKSALYQTVMQIVKGGGVDNA